MQRRQFATGVCSGTAAAAALYSLLETQPAARGAVVSNPAIATTSTHSPPRARRVISLFMHGGPSQLDLWDDKPLLRERQGEELPPSVRGNQRLTGMTSGQAAFPLAASAFRFRPHGSCGLRVSELLPRLATCADDICLIRSVHSEAINHDPAATFLQTGHQQPGRPSLGSWLSYGLGSENSELPAFVVLLSRGSAARPADPLYPRLWGSGFIPSSHQGVAFRAGGDPVLYLGNPPGIDAHDRKRMLDAIRELNRDQSDRLHDPEIETRIAQYEMAFRMQASVPQLTDLSSETPATFALYGPDARTPGTFAANCLLARRLAESGVRFIQLYHRGWDQHYNLPGDLRLQCQDVDQPCAALLQDLKQRGLLEDTLIFWGGEFGRTTYSQGRLERGNYGRDHHGRCFSVWLAGGGIRGGTVHGASDDFGWSPAADPVHVHDLNATLLHCLGIDHTRLTYRFQGRDYRLTDVHGRVVEAVLS
ncbi:MAG: DUF1501 domain-containing protein [Planctomycetota bacterium]